MVSIIIPTYNRRTTICRTIDSILCQTYTDYEIIVVDDGSSDNTRELVKKTYGKEKLSYIYKQNEGVQIARNTGLFSSIGDLVLFLDSDDMLLSDALAKCVLAFNSDEDLGAVYFLTGIKASDGTGKISCARNDFLEGTCYNAVLKQGYLTSTSFIMFRKSVFAKIGVWDYSFPACQDDDMCFRLSKYFKVKLIPEILGVFGTDEGEHIGSSAVRVEKGWLALWRKYEDDIIQLCGKRVLLQRYRKNFINFSNLSERGLAKRSLSLIRYYSFPYAFYCMVSYYMRVLVSRPIHLLKKTFVRVYRGVICSGGGYNLKNYCCIDSSKKCFSIEEVYYAA